MHTWVARGRPEGGDGGWNLLWGGDEEIRDALVCWWHLFRRGFPKGSMGFEMKRLQSSADSYLRKTLNIHTRLPVVPWKRKIHLQAETYHSKQITPTCWGSRLKVEGKLHLGRVTRHPVWPKIVTYIYWDVGAWNGSQKCILSDWRQSNWSNII